ncbi:MFS transporter [Arthrobacter sp. RCC_34]|uniref:MFS transporter n=1 Tax=Arthrobacter sp. RCC_34 TaxID=3239230 RepID=UPI003524C7B2
MSDARGSVLRIPEFRRLLQVMSASVFAEFLLESVVYCWIVAATAADPGVRSLLLGSYVVLSTIPRIFGTAVMGVWSDSLGAALSLKISTAARAGLAVVAVGSAYLGRAEAPVVAVVLFVLVVACSTANQLFAAARAKAVQLFVPQELRGSASSLSMTVLTALSIVSASLGPFAFSLAGLEVCLLLITGLFAVGAALAFAGFPRGGRGDGLPPSARPGFLEALVEGWKVTWTVRRLRVVLLGSVLYGVPLGVNNVALVLLWVDTKGGTLIDYGVGSSLFGVGGFVGAVAAHRLVNRCDLHRLFAASLGALGISYALLAWTPDHGVSFGLMFASGFLFSLYAVVQSPILLEAAPPELTGRVVSTTAGVAALSSLAAAVVVSLLFALPGAGGLLVPWAVCLGGGVTVLGGALLLVRGRDREEPEPEAAASIREK